MTESLGLAQFIVYSLSEQWEAVLLFLPVLLLIEMPLIVMVNIGLLRWYWHQPEMQETNKLTHYPTVSFVITCYGEGDAIGITIDTLAEQIYPAHIEILAVVDGARQNQHTYQAALAGVERHKKTRLREVVIVPKWQRGGRVSTLNAGLSKARNEIVINVDGDTSFDNEMLLNMVKQFQDPNVVGCGGALRVRNWNENILTRMQALEYMMSMQGNKTGMANLGLLNNISGAFGAFRKKTLKQVGGWDTHTAEDLDLTMRFKQYQIREREQKLAFTPHAVGHTDVPSSLRDLVLQRLRWDGDLLFLYLRKHIKGLSPKLLGWKTFIYTYIYGVVQNTLLPVMMLLFMFYMIFNYELTLNVSVVLILYSIYMIFTLISFTIYITFVSERAKADLKMAGWLPLYPIYTFFVRCVTAFSVVNEIVRRSHEESSMAPWWVLKRGRKF